LSVLVLTVIAH
jgi:NAD(P)H dehydrogenase (quinone)